MKRNEMKEYRVWQAMKARCYAPSCKNMGYYQKDNITVCERWKNNFDALWKWKHKTTMKEAILHYIKQYEEE